MAGKIPTDKSANKPQFNIGKSKPKYRSVHFYDNLPDPVRLAEYDLSASEAKIFYYIAIQCGLNPKKCYVRETNKQLAYLLGMELSTMKKALSNLMRFGLVKSRVTRKRSESGTFYSQRYLTVNEEILGIHSDKNNKIPFHEECTKLKITERYIKVKSNRERLMKNPVVEETIDIPDDEDDLSSLSPEERAAKIDEEGLEF